MGVFSMRLPDVGEGVAEAELVEWLVAVGDEVTPDTALADVLTDKANVEVSSPVAGRVAALHGQPGDILAVGGPLVDIETEGDGSASDSALSPRPVVEPEPLVEVEGDAAAQAAVDPPPDEGDGKTHAARVLAAPAVRARAKDLAIEIREVHGTGPDGRVTHGDLDRVAGSAGSGVGGSEAIAVRGVRRQIAKRMARTWSDVPHITYVESVDVSELERTRAELNRSADDASSRITVLPFVARAIVVALRDQPQLNAHYDHQAETLKVFDSVDIGIATQTDDGLRVGVVRHSESLGLRALADEIAAVAGAARDGSATRDQLTGSTITITSLGAMGGLVTTPIINAPEVAIVGVNKIEVRPVWVDDAFVPRKMMNLSSSFDHRMVDGWDAAMFIQRIKTLLETPALLFVD